MADPKTNRFIVVYSGVILLIVIISLFIKEDNEVTSDIERPISREAVDAAIEKHKAALNDAGKAQTNTKSKEDLKPAKLSDRRIVTIDGTDPDAGKVIKEINLWKNYQTRTWAGRVRHGQKVYFIKREGDGVLVETKSGLQGWVTYWFIKEEK